MMQYIKLMYSATPENGSGNEPDKINKTGSMPDRDIDLMDVSKNVSDSWIANPQITLLWKNSATFKKEVDSYADNLVDRIDTGTKRPGVTLSLMQQDKQIDEGVTEVKIYIAKKFKKANAPAQYPRYGIVKVGDTYKMSLDRNQRKATLGLMVKAIAEDGFGEEEYGSNFWKAIQADYTASVDAAGANAGNVSEKVATKKMQKRGIRKVLKALRKALEANYPDTYREMLRKWGWQKERH
jgi:hypothetical protein